MDFGDLDLEVHLQRGCDPQVVLDRHPLGKRTGGEPERAIGGTGGRDLPGQHHPPHQMPRTHLAEVGVAGQDRAQRLQVQHDRHHPLLDPFVIVEHRDRSAPDALADDVDHVGREQPHVGDLRRGDQNRRRVAVELQPTALPEDQGERGSGRRIQRRRKRCLRPGNRARLGGGGRCEGDGRRGPFGGSGCRELRCRRREAGLHDGGAGRRDRGGVVRGGRGFRGAGPAVETEHKARRLRERGSRREAGCPHSARPAPGGAREGALSGPDRRLPEWARERGSSGCAGGGTGSVRASGGVTPDRVSEISDRVFRARATGTASPLPRCSRRASSMRSESALASSSDHQVGGRAARARGGIVDPTGSDQHAHMVRSDSGMPGPNPGAPPNSALPPARSRRGARRRPRVRWQSRPRMASPVRTDAARRKCCRAARSRFRTSAARPAPSRASACTAGASDARSAARRKCRSASAKSPL